MMERSEIARGEPLDAAEWARRFRRELAALTSTLARNGDAVEVHGWTLRLVWNDDGRRGLLLLYQPRDSECTGRGATVDGYVPIALELRTDPRAIADKVVRAIDTFAPKR